MQSKARIICDGTTGGSFEWKCHEFTLSLPPNCINKPVDLSIKACLSNNFQICEGVYIVSAVFSIETNFEKLEKPAVLFFPHCIDIQTKNDIAKMRFCIQHENSFEVIDGNFKIASPLGSVELTEFSKIFIVFLQHGQATLKEGFKIIVEDSSSDYPSSSHAKDPAQPGMPVMCTENNEKGVSTVKNTADSQDNSSAASDNFTESSNPQNATTPQETASEQCKEQVAAIEKNHPDPPVNINYVEILHLPKCRNEPGNWNAFYCITHSLEIMIQV